MRSRFGSIEQMRRLALALAICGTMLPACRPNPTKGATLEIRTPQSDRDADVFVDGNYIGQVDALSAAGTTGLELAPGVHRVEVRKHGRFPVQRTIRVDGSSGSVVTVDAELLEDPS